MIKNAFATVDTSAMVHFVVQQVRRGRLALVNNVTCMMHFVFYPLQNLERVPYRFCFLGDLQ